MKQLDTPDGGAASRRTTTWLLTLVYSLLVVALASSHVLWRDEARALNIVMASGSLPELFRNLHNEGHPALYYLLLFAGFHISHSTLVLKATSLATAIAAVFVFLSRSPFTLWHRSLFILGACPLYWYSVVCRSYGLGMLLLILFAAMHKHRFERPFTVALIIGLLANTHALTLVIAGALWCSLVVEFLMKRLAPAPGERPPFRALLALVVAAIGMGVSVVQLPPDRTSTVTPLFRIDAATALDAVAHALLHTGDIYAAPFGVTSGYFFTFILLLFLVYLLRQPTLALVLVLVSVGFAAFFALVYPPQGYHSGLFLLLIVVLLWLDAENPPRRVPARLARATDAIAARKDLVLSLLLLMQVAIALSTVAAYASADASSSRRLGEYLRAQSDLKDAILIGEPGAFMEAVHYYAPNEIYFPREDRFGTWAHFTTESRATLSLHDLLATAERVTHEYRRPVVIALAHRLSPAGPFAIPGPFGSSFVYTRESLEEWRAKTTMLAEFRRALGDENYDVYVLNERPGER